MSSSSLKLRGLLLLLRPWPTRTGSRLLDVLDMLQNYREDVLTDARLQRDLLEVRAFLEPLIASRAPTLAEADYALSCGDSRRASAVLAATRPRSR